MSSLQLLWTLYQFIVHLLFLIFKKHNHIKFIIIFHYDITKKKKKQKQTENILTLLFEIFAIYHFNKGETGL